MSGKHGGRNQDSHNYGQIAQAAGTVWEEQVKGLLFSERFKPDLAEFLPGVEIDALFDLERIVEEKRRLIKLATNSPKVPDLLVRDIQGKISPLEITHGIRSREQFRDKLAQVSKGALRRLGRDYEIEYLKRRNLDFGEPYVVMPRIEAIVSLKRRRFKQAVDQNDIVTLHRFELKTDDFISVRVMTGYYPHTHVNFVTFNDLSIFSS